MKDRAAYVCLLLLASTIGTLRKTPPENQSTGERLMQDTIGLKCQDQLLL